MLRRTTVSSLLALSLLAACQSTPPLPPNVVGPDGGLVASDDGNLTVEVPAGAVGDNTTITISPKLGTPAAPSGYALIPNTTYEVKGSPVTLSKPIKLQIKYTLASTALKSQAKNPDNLILYTLVSNAWQTVSGTDTDVDVTKKTAKVTVSSFGIYGLGVPNGGPTPPSPPSPPAPPSPPSTPPPPPGPQLSFLNVSAGQVLSGAILAPGVEVKNATATSVNVEVLNAGGTRLWQNGWNTTPACVIVPCGYWNTRNLPDGQYTIRATATLSGGGQLTGTINFSVNNSGGATPPPPSQLNFINITEGQTLSGSPLSPGVNVSNASFSQIVLELRRSDNTELWTNRLNTNPACLIAVCDRWDTTRIPNGNYFMRATVNLTNGQTLTGQVNFSINNGGATSPPPPANPQLGFINIIEGQTLSGSPAAPGVNVTNGTVSQVVLELRRSDGTGGWANTLTSNPACVIGVCTNWDTTRMANGAYYMQATATLSGGQTLSGRVNFQIDNGNPTPPPAAPQLSFINITEGQTLSGPVVSPGASVSNANVNQMVLELRRSDNTELWTNTLSGNPACLIGACTTWDTTRISNGTYYMRVTATLSNGQTLTGRVNFTVSNGGTTPPPAPPPPPGPTPPPPAPPPPPPPSGNKVPWNQVDSWGIQYQGFNQNESVAVDTLNNVNVDMLIIGRFDGVGQEWLPDQIARLAQRKWVLSYISVGQAQTIEWYWQSWWGEGNPWFIANPWTFGGTYNVRYWAAEWQSLVFQTIDRIIARNFDGIFLDQSDPYWNPGFPGGASSSNIRASMDLVCNIYNYANSKKPGFRVMVNGGGNQIDLFGSEYWRCLDANSAEHMWYTANGEFRSSGYRDYTIPQLQRLVAAGKKVFTFDYTLVQNEINNVVGWSRGLGFYPTFNTPSISATPPNPYY